MTLWILENPRCIRELVVYNNPIQEACDYSMWFVRPHSYCLGQKD